MLKKKKKISPMKGAVLAEVVENVKVRNYADNRTLFVLDYITGNAQISRQKLNGFLSNDYTDPRFPPSGWLNYIWCSRCVAN